MARPRVDVVVPFRGERAALRRLEAGLALLRRRASDTVVIVDNTPECGSPEVRERTEVSVLQATERAAPGLARNRGAALGDAEWLVFFDADTDPSPDLLDRYFDPPPGERTALLAGGVRDEPVPPAAPASARYAYIRSAMDQENAFRFRWPFAQMANAACRREAFEAVRGFREDIRAAEDADLAYRLQAAGWGLERREDAFVVHRSRPTGWGFAAQKLVHGAGGAWLDREYPGAVPARRRPGLAWWGVRTAVGGLVSAARTRSRDRALWALFEPLEHLSYELGRSLPNHRPWSALRSSRLVRRP